MNTDWTVTSKRVIPDWQMTRTSDVDKVSEEENDVWRPTSTSIVSRIPHGSDQDAQFIFRAPKLKNVPLVIC